MMILPNIRRGTRSACGRMSFGKLKPGETSGEEVLTSTLRRPSIGSVAVSFLASQKTQSSPRFSRLRRESQGRAGANQDGLRGAGGCARARRLRGLALKSGLWPWFPSSRKPTPTRTTAVTKNLICRQNNRAAITGSSPSFFANSLVSPILWFLFAGRFPQIGLAPKNNLTVPALEILYYRSIILR